MAVCSAQFVEICYHLEIKRKSYQLSTHYVCSASKHSIPENCSFPSQQPQLQSQTWPRCTLIYINSQVLIAGLFSQLEGAAKVLLAFLEVLLGAGDHAQLEAAFHLASFVVHFRGQLEVLLHKQLHLVLVVREVLRADLADIAHRHRLSAQVGHLDRMLQRVLEVVNAVFLILQSVVAESEVDRR